MMQGHEFINPYDGDIRPIDGDITPEQWIDGHPGFIGGGPSGCLYEERGI